MSVTEVEHRYNVFYGMLRETQGNSQGQCTEHTATWMFFNMDDMVLGN